MPSPFDEFRRQPAAPQVDPFDAYRRSATSPQEPEEESGGGISSLAGLLGIGGLALLARKPKLALEALKKGNAVRQQLMLTAAPIKSALGNVGAVAIESAERGSTAPLKEFFSGRTLRDFKNAYRANRSTGPVGMGNTNLPGPTPGRLMGAGDEATVGALHRAGLSDTEAQAAVLQSPLTGKLGEVLDSPEARYIFPFRRTPFNQFFEGFKTIKDSGPVAQAAGRAKHPSVFNTVAAAGALHGAATADEDYPLTLPLGVAASAKYGAPYGAAAILGRFLAGGDRKSGAASSMLPLSEYGVESSLTDPFQPFRRNPAERYFE